jgi:hypothetical protein
LRINLAVCVGARLWMLFKNIFVNKVLSFFIAYYL